MSVQKKSLISNRAVMKKAMIASQSSEVESLSEVKSLQTTALKSQVLKSTVLKASAYKVSGLKRKA
ncbi:MAG TPA: hypothetical protein VMS18_29345 [Candidatus Binatia bacterium]|nr:hypothetical protein [Candidatus Binatia bacterium]